MYEYKFVKIEVKEGFFNSTPKDDYQKIINSHAKQGWRFVQIFAPSIRGYGKSSYFELIF